MNPLLSDIGQLDDLAPNFYPLNTSHESPTEPDWTKDFETLRKLSLLRDKIPHKRPLLDESLLSFLLDERQSKEITPSQEMIDFFYQKSSPEHLKWQQGLHVEQDIQEAIDTGTTDAKKGRKTLRDLSRKLSKQVSSLHVGESMVLFHTIPSLDSLSNHFKTMLQSILPKPIAQRIKENSTPNLEKLTQSTLEQFVDPLKTTLLENLASPCDKLRKDLLDKGLHSLLPNVLKGGILEKSLRKISNSFKYFIKRKLIKLFPKENRKTLEKFASEIAEHGVSQAIEKRIQETIQAVTQKVCDTSDTIQQQILKELPPSVSSFLKMLGLNVSSGSVWFEIERKSASTFRLKVHGIGEALQFHPMYKIENELKRQVTCEFDDISLDKFPPEFFFQLLSMRAWPVWSHDIKFSFENLYQELFARFGKSVEKPDFTIPLEDSHYIKGPFNLLEELHLRKLKPSLKNVPQQNKNAGHTELPPTAEKPMDRQTSRLLWLYPLLKDEMLSLWDAWNQSEEKEKYVSSLLSVCKAILPLSAELLSRKLITEEESKSIFATTREINERLRQSGIDRETDFLKRAAQQIDHRIETIISLFGNKKHYLEAIQESLVDFFGPEMEACIHSAIHEIKISSKTQDSEDLDKEILDSIWTRFNKNLKNYQAELKEFFEEATFWDYLFLVLKLISKAKEIILFSCIFTLPLKAFTIINSLSTVRWITATILSKIVKPLLGLITPFILKKVLPKCVYDAYKKVRAKCREICKKLTQFKHRVEKRMLAFVIKKLLPRYVSATQKEAITLLAKQWKSKFSKSGEISFNTDPVTPEVTDVVLQSKEVKLSQVDAAQSIVPPKPVPHLTQPYKVTLTKENLQSELHSWEQQLSLMNPKDAYSQFYLVEQLKNLPIPSHDESCFWRQVDDPLKIMHSIYKFHLYIDGTYGIITSLTLHAILTALARRLHSYESQEITPPELHALVYHPKFVTTDPSFAKRLSQIYAYFNIDTSKNNFPNGYQHLCENCLLHFHFGLEHTHTLSHNGTNIFAISIKCAMTQNSQRFERFLVLFPEIAKKFRLIEGTRKSPLSYQEKFCLLFENSSLLEYGIPSDQGILPDSFSLLEMSYHAILCHMYHNPTDIKKIPRFCVNQLSQESWFLLPIFKIHKDFFWLNYDLSLQYSITPVFPKYVPPFERENYYKNEGMDPVYTYDSELILRRLSCRHTSFYETMSSCYYSLEDDLFRFSLLENLLKESPHHAEHVGAFFHEGLSYILKHCDGLDSTYHGILRKFLSIGILTASMCESIITGSSKYFPNFREEIFGRLWTAMSNSILGKRVLIMALTTLYENRDCEFDENSPNEDMMHDLILYVYLETKLCCNLDPPIDFEIELKLQRIALLLDKPGSKHLRDRILSSVYEKCTSTKWALPESGEYPSWNGHFPYYTQGTFILNLSLKSESQIKPSISPFIQEIKKQTEKALRCRVSSMIEVKQNEFFVKELGVTIVVNNDILVFYRKEGQKRFCLLSSDEASFTETSSSYHTKNDLIWLQMDTPLELHFGSPWLNNIVRFPIKEAKEWEPQKWQLKVEWNPINEVIESVNLESVHHSLHLLSWLTSPENIQVYRSSKETDHFCLLNILDLNLSFHIKKDASGEYQAYLDKMLPGFFISKKQTHPSLESHSRYLILENAQHEFKVLIPSLHPSQLLSSYLVASHIKEFSHPLLNHLLEKEWGLNASQSKNTYAIFSIDSVTGILTSEQSHAIAFLVFYSLVNKQKDQLKHALRELLKLSLLEKFSKETLDMLFPLTILPLIDSNHRIMILSLQVMALLENNKLLPSSEDTPTGTEYIWKVAAQWALKMTTFLKYTQSLKPTTQDEDKLSEEQELTILHAISQEGVFLLKTGCESLSENVRKIAYFMGFEEAAEHLMMPHSLSNRYKTLKTKPSVTEKHTTSKCELLVRTLSGVSSETNTLDASSDQNFMGQSKFTLIRDLVQIALNPPWQQMNNEQLIETLHISEWVTFLFQGDLIQGIEQIPIKVEHYHPGDISTYFLCYYALATEKKQISSTTKTFQIKQQLLPHFLSQLKFSGKTRESILLQWLRILCREAKDAVLPTPKQLKTDAEKAKEDPCEFQSYLKSISQYCKSQEDLFSKYPLLQAASKFVVSETIAQVSKNGAEIAAKIAFNIFAGPIWQAIKLGKSGLALAQTVQTIFQEEMGRKQSEEQKDTQFLLFSDSLASQLKSIDHRFDLFLKHVFENYFQITPNLESPRTQPIQLDHNASTLTRRHCDAFNASCLDYDKRETRKTGSSQFKSKESLSSLISLLEEVTHVLMTQLEQDKANILTFVNAKRVQKRQRPPTVREALLKGFQFDSEDEDSFLPLDFTTVIHLFLRAHIKECEQVTYLSLDDIQTLHNHLYNRCVIQSRYDQIHRILSFAKKIKEISPEDTEAFMEEMTFEFQRTHEYDVSLIPTKLVRAHLVFEMMNQKLLWKNQVSQEDKLLTQKGTKKAVELIPGSGKTAFGIPTSDFFLADGDTVVFNIWTLPAAYVSTRQTATQALSTFGQSAHALHFDRSTKLNENILWGLLRRFKVAISKEQQFNLSKEEAQSLELKLIILSYELVYRRDSLSYVSIEEKEKELYNYVYLLRLMRKNGAAVIDEVHETFNRKKELNYPLGTSSVIDSQYMRTLFEIMNILSSAEEFRPILSLKKNQRPLEGIAYQEKVLPILSQKIVNWPFLEIDPSLRREVSDYIQGSLKMIPQGVLNSPKRRHIDLIKGVLTLILPKALALKPRENFGPSKENPEAEYARPYEACDKPNEKATIRNPFEAAIKTFLSFLYSGLNPKQTQKLIDYLYQKAKTRSHIPLDETRYGRLFASWCPGKLLSKAYDEPIETLHALLKDHNEAILTYAQFVGSQIRYYSNNVKSNSSNFASMFHSFLADSGSLYNHETYPEGTEVIWDKGTQGETKHLMQLKQKEGSVKILNENTSSNILLEIAKFIVNDHHCALIDRGALLRGLSNEEVAKILLNTFALNHSPYQGVVFYNDLNEQMILETGSSLPVPLHERNVSPHQRFTYFDQAHTYASDIPQPYFGTAIVTLSENTTLENFAQAVWRMRGLKKRQTITVVMTPELRNKISPEKHPTLEDIYAFIIRNEAQEIGEDNYHADRQKICDITRRMVLDKMYSLLDDENDTASTFSKKFLNFFKEFEDLFIEEETYDPTQLFGAIDAQEDPRNLLLLTLYCRCARCEQSSHFNSEELKVLQSLKKHWEESLHQKVSKYPDTVHTYINGGLPSFTTANSLFQEQQIVEASGEEEKATENETHQVKETDQQLNTYSTHQSELQMPYKWRNPTLWNDSLDITHLSWLKFKDPHSNLESIVSGCATEMTSLFQQGSSAFLSAVSSSLSNSLSKHALSSTQAPQPILHKENPQSSDPYVSLFRLQDFFSKSDDPIIARASIHFEKNLFCTHNFAPVRSEGPFEYAITPLARNRKTVSEILVIQENSCHSPQGNLYLGLIDHSDVHFWKKKLLENRSSAHSIAIYGVGLRRVFYTNNRTIMDTQILHQNPKFLRGLVQIKFYDGDLCYTHDECHALKTWLREGNAHLMKELFLKILDSREKQTDPNRYIIDDIFEE